MCLVLAQRSMSVFSPTNLPGQNIIQTRNTINKPGALLDFMSQILPSDIPPQRPTSGIDEYPDIHTPEDLLAKVEEGIKIAPMPVRLSPHILSTINWQDPLNDPVRRQFIPMKSTINVTHPAASLDPVAEVNSSPVEGLIHRYPTKALFMTTSVCPVYCRFCFRSYTVGTETETVKKLRFLPLLKRWKPRLEYIANTPHLRDIVLSGGDTYLLEPEQVEWLGKELLKIPHIRILRFATKGVGVSPSRLVDPDDAWTKVIIDLAQEARKMSKHVCVHTHINSTQEITWVTRRGAKRLYEEGVTVRNQSVLLNGVNNTVPAMMNLIHALSDMHIEPYYVYQSDMIPGAEDLRTPIRESHHIESEIRNQNAGFLMPRFVYDVPASGKRPTLFAHYADEGLGLSKFRLPEAHGGSAEYWDPLWSLTEEKRVVIGERFGVGVQGVRVGA
ncbi:L-lysine 2,3-aminomutase [Fulvia fulva]|uniref:L-lysine 2,3-aminomutase n=1 Tax=Passalora fulva TaxID=5499 RepID=A0A9Q8LH14_PASFU|nr:L-lysine 2,3-aminomutase [Fulvia fulva]KAK4624208.1 L-lysine 2,3-aminomutase [Fulvia fulva]KAK4625893.1 L-lysine 2,3-aminomutase [Fulvia fulva]UJO17247.1 L-lysine 2,3-aminomutase [Fulvia fulva]WPV15014.1 L-lysine 2,3-aminomutase [Fulvia fulva]WPV29813.1 L-lysine 2,3-aminomutase [Fulvia fulva]